MMAETLGPAELTKMDRIIDNIPSGSPDIAENLFGSFAHLRDADGLPQLTRQIEGCSYLPGGYGMRGAVFEAQVAAKIRKGEGGAVNGLERVSADGLENMNTIDTLTGTHALQVKWTSASQFELSQMSGRSASGTAYLDEIAQQVAQRNVRQGTSVVPALWLNKPASPQILNECASRGIQVFIRP